MRRSPRNVRIAFNHAGLTHYGGAFFLHEFLRVLQIRNFLALNLHWPRRNNHYTVSQMVLALTWPLILGLDRIETASLLHSNGTFQFLTGLPSFPDPQTLRRFLITAPRHLALQLKRVNDRLLQTFIHLPDHRSRLTFDLDSTVVSVFGHQQGATLGYNRRHPGKRCYQPLLCAEAGSAHLWGARLLPDCEGNHGVPADLFSDCWSNVPADIREVRVRADSGFYGGEFLDALEDRNVQYAVVARIFSPLRRLLPGLKYQPANPGWEMAVCEHKLHEWPEARKHVVARTLVNDDSTDTLFTLGRYKYRCWVTNLDLTPAGVWHFYDGRAEIEARIRELRQDFALVNIPTRAFAANALYLDIIRFAYNLVAAFQRLCLPAVWQPFTLRTLRQKLFLLPGELTRPGNRPVLRLHRTPSIEPVAEHIRARLKTLSSLC
jgi:hypothetical protein